jgi:hypothetical protein
MIVDHFGNRLSHRLGSGISVNVYIEHQPVFRVRRDHDDRLQIPQRLLIADRTVDD